MNISLSPVGYVRNSRKTPEDDHWNAIISDIVLADTVPADALAGISNFSHLDIIFYFDKVKEDTIVMSGHPRGNPAFPLTGIFAQRKKDRPNKIGLCTVTLIGHGGNKITVRGLDAIDGTPVLDIKPVFKEFLPKGDIIQPGWVADLMKNYW